MSYRPRGKLRLYFFLWRLVPWRLHFWYRNTYCPGTLRRHLWEPFEDELGPSEGCAFCGEARFTGEFLSGRSPNLVGRRIEIPAADHPHTGQQGTVVAQRQSVGSTYDDLVVRLDDGSTTMVFEPEADLLT